MACHLGRAVALATFVVFLHSGGVDAAPISYTYRAVVTEVTGLPGVGVGEHVHGSLTYDPNTASGCGPGCFGSAAWTFSASVGSFGLAEAFRWRLHDGPPGADEQILEGEGFAQFGLSFRDDAATALAGDTLADLSVYLGAWDMAEARYHEISDAGTLVRGWTGEITYIGVPGPSVPAPATLALVAAGVVLLGGIRRWRQRVRGRHPSGAARQFRRC